jgi:peptidyl-prolyl cis-trans isomerase B (cyclophilin B)
VLVLAFALAVAAAGCGGSDEPPKAAAQPSPTGRGLDANGCEAVAAPAAEERDVAAPESAADPATRYLAAVSTNCGQFDITLDAKRAPKTVGSFVHLAREGFFDGLSIHRVVPGFVFQGGDPAGDGSGGPGYTIVEPPPRGLVYRKGTVAMAKSPADAPGTSGSQFFVVSGAKARELPPEYALLGRVTGGHGAVERIGAVQSDPRTDRPPAPIVIESLTIAEL